VVIWWHAPKNNAVRSPIIKNQPIRANFPLDGKRSVRDAVLRAMERLAGVNISWRYVLTIM
jgi:hypothetical protein